ncbi:DUF2961 domain-containing protein [Amycolatopsis minnesotensis]|uniref:Fibronectin type-III domain-containing protein n=1 Tax=Amycolatopsis minnesotensis TaxID=337894 RepID=A0ABP5E9Y7_9PSEU
MIAATMLAGMLLAGTVLAGTVAGVPAPASAAPAADPSLGWGPFRDVNAIPQLRGGEQTGQFSSYDRAGGNDDGGYGTYSCLRDDSDGCVLADRAGAGEITSIWLVGDIPPDDGEEGATAKKQDDPPVLPPRADTRIKVELDGKVVLEGRVGDIVDGKLGAPYVWPLVGNTYDTKGGMVIKVPMPYRSSMRVSANTTPGYYHVDYRAVADPATVPRFDPADKALDVVDRLRGYGFRDPKPIDPRQTVARRTSDIADGAAVPFADLRGAGRITQLRVALPQVVPSPGHDDDGRQLGAGGTSTFTARVDPANTGVRLTRQLDSGVANQQAEVLVDGKPAGQWRGAAATPAGAWANDQLALPAALTAGKTSITVTTKAKSPFTEFRYDIHSRAGDSWTRTDGFEVGAWHPGDEQSHHYAVKGQTWQGFREYRFPSDPAEITRSDAVLAGARVKVDIGGRTTVDAPVGEFFGSGLGEFDSRSLMSAIDPAPDGWYTAWWPMPYAGGAKVSLVNSSGVPITGAKVEVSSVADDAVAGQLASGAIGYFRATHGQADDVPAKQDIPLLDARGRGTLYGVTQTIRGASDTANAYDYLEGDERFSVDGAATPAWQGTGTEDLYESGWYFLGGYTVSNPLTGSPAVESESDGCKAICTGVSRLFLPDSISFSGSLHAGIEHGPVNTEPGAQSWTAFWYGQDQPALRQTDLLDLGDGASRAAHGFQGDAATGGPRSSTFEGPADTAPVADLVSTSAKPTTFSAAVDPANRGVRLYRTGDQEKPGQSATVLVDGKAVGTWRQAGSNEHSRWLEDVFALPPSVTAGKSRVTVSLQPTPGAAPWSAAQYRVLSEVPPYADKAPPAAVRPVTAGTDRTNAVNLQWPPAADNGGMVDRYEVYASDRPDVPITPGTLVGTTVGTAFQHRALNLGEKRYYRVRAIDAAGNASAPSPTATGVSGTRLVVEGASLVPPRETSSSVLAANHPIMSDTTYAVLGPTKPGDHFTSTFTVPRAGSYDLTAYWATGEDFAPVRLAVDGTAVGEPYDCYQDDVMKVAEVKPGKVKLSAGTHRLTVTATGGNPKNPSPVVGLDRFTLDLLPG